MELDGVVQNGVVVPDDPSALTEGIRVRIRVPEPPAAGSFGERFARFRGVLPADTPADLADQHDHYRLGTPKQ